MKILFRIFVLGIIVMAGLVAVLLLLPLIILLLIFQPSRRRFYTFRFGSGNGMAGTQRPADERDDVPPCEAVIDVEAQEVGRTRRPLDASGERRDY